MKSTPASRIQFSSTGMQVRNVFGRPWCTMSGGDARGKNLGFFSMPLVSTKKEESIIHGSLLSTNESVRLPLPGGCRHEASLYARQKCEGVIGWTNTRLRVIVRQDERVAFSYIEEEDCCLISVDEHRQDRDFPGGNRGRSRNDTCLTPLNMTRTAPLSNARASKVSFVL